MGNRVEEESTMTAAGQHVAPALAAAARGGPERAHIPSVMASWASARTLLLLTRRQRSQQSGLTSTMASTVASMMAMLL